MLAKNPTMRRILSSFLVLVMVLGLLPVSVFATEGDVQNTEVVNIDLTADNEGTVVEDESPANETEEPAGETEEPAGETEEPAGEVEEPAGEVEEPTGEVEEPAGETEQPAGETEEPAGEGEAVIEEPEVPMAVAPVEDTLINGSIQAEAEDGAIITVSGLLPEGAYVTAKPVEITLEDLTVLAAYDITIFDGEGNVWQPDESVVVDIQTPVLADVEEVEIYHMENVDAEPEHVETVTAESDVATFSAESFSIYVVTVTQNGHEVGKLTMTEGQSFSIRGHYSDWDHQWSIVQGNDALEITSGRHNRTVQLKAVGSGTAIVQHTYYYWFWKQTECYEVSIEVKELEPTDTKVPVKFYVLDPERGAPTSGEDQGYKNYFPSSTNQKQKYNVYDGISGTMTDAAWDALRGADGRLTIGDEYTNPNGIALGLDDSWFTLTTEADALKAMYESFGISPENAKDYELVWYVIKCQGGQGKSQKEDDNGAMSDVHVDGYLKNVAVDVTYHSNFGDDEVTVDDTARTGAYTTWNYGATNLPDRNGYTFLGWSEKSGDDATVDYEAGESMTLMSSLHLYAVWAETPKTGTLTVNKIVEGKDTLPDGFKILVKSNGNTVYTLGLTDGEGVITPDATTNADAKYTWTISDVTPGIYSIDEENALVDGYDLTSSANPTMVSVKAGGMSVVEVTNKYVDTSNATASFTIKKVESGTTNGLDGAVFHICADMECDGTCDGGQTVTTDNGGLATISGLKSGETYYLRETEAPEGYELGNTVYKITVAGQHEKQSTGGNIFSYLWKLVASMFVGTEDNAAAVVKDQQGNFLIPNKKSPTGTLKITKTFTGVDNLPDSFKIKVTPEDGTEKLYTLDDATIEAAGYYEWDLILPEGSYQVEETGYQVADYNVSIQIDEKTNVTNPRTTVVVTEDYETSLSFVNTYTATTPTPVSPVDISFSGMKYLDNSTTNVPAFTFVLKSFVKDIDNPLSETSTQIAEVQNDNLGRISFPAQSFANEGKYWYQVAERIASPNGYRYDTTVYYIEVVVTKTADELVAVPTYYKSVTGVKGDTLVETTDGLNFYNYSVPADKDALTITKTGAGSVTVGSNITYTITVSNPSEYAAENVTVTDTLDSKLTYVESDNGGVYDETTRTVTWNVGTLAAGESKVLTVTVTANATGTVENIAYVDYTGNGDPISSTPVTTTVTDGGTTPTPTPTTTNPPYVPDDDDDGTYIPDDKTPLNPSPEPSEEPTPTPSEDPGTEIPEETTPLDPGPVEPSEPDEEIPEGEVPMGDLPQTGAVAAPVNPATTAGLVALAFSMAGCGLYFTFGRKKGEEED